MKRSLILPAAVALTAHAWLLFGFTRGHRPVESVVPPEPKAEPFQVVVPDDPPEVVVAAGGAPADARTLPPMQPDLPALTPSESVITMPMNPPPARITSQERLAPGPIDYSGVGGDGNKGIGQSGSVIDASLLDKEPRTLVQPAPVYPFEMRRSGQSGEVTVAFTVDESGRVLNPRVVKSSARDFEEPTLRAVEKWRFEPGKRNGKPVRFQMMVPVGFKVSPE